MATLSGRAIALIAQEREEAARLTKEAMRFFGEKLARKIMFAQFPPRRRKRPSKRRIWARFMLGRWVSKDAMILHNLDCRAGDMPVEFEDYGFRVRRKRSLRRRHNFIIIDEAV